MSYTDRDYEFIDQPPPKKRGPKGSTFTNALLKTLQDGKAIRIPLDGETFAVVRNRYAGRASSFAKRHDASLLTARLDDGSVAIWLVKKETK